MSAAKTKALKLIEENPVVVFSKSWCPYCRTAKATLTAQGAKFHVEELDQIDDGDAIKAALSQENGSNTVPMIYIGGEFVGGNSDLQGIKKDLPEKLKKAGAV
ncbi:glutaredoxin-domain-containing protein [Pseudovirgaria hyperparasitica]|uniref:Glutaredoxin-domain-containing protein n=1 Tax=Pseudovirgaria hyperparasitica TaxID=470096 RepID=A0A6A6W573_9PEZI|nr:glutaredoxin-domain-containing protein [Pseudovirgaria hyperparasitica]KAF2758078.1 glutaredoxin-domain-containing protein [Pseudovirgaria hyperparasitica]